MAKEPSVFGVAYWPHRTAAGPVLHLAVAGVHPTEVQEIARHAFKEMLRLQQAMGGVAWIEATRAYVGAQLRVKWPGHGYWIQVENDRLGEQEYGTLPEALLPGTADAIPAAHE